MKKLCMVLCALLLLIAPIAQAGELRIESAPDPKDIKIAPQQVVDREGVKISLEGVQYRDYFTPVLRFLIENNSGIDIGVQAVDIAVNGAMVSSSMQCDVLNGKKAYTELTMLESDLKRSGIDMLIDISLRFHVYDMDSWKVLFETDTIDIQTEAAPDAKQEFDDSGLVLVDTANITIKAQSLQRVDDMEQLTLYIKNKTSSVMMVNILETSVNGYMLEPYLDCRIAPGKIAYAPVIFLDIDLERSKIETMQEMECYFFAYEDNTYQTLLNSEVVHVDFDALTVHRSARDDDQDMATAAAEDTDDGADRI